MANKRINPFQPKWKLIFHMIFHRGTIKQHVHIFCTISPVIYGERLLTENMNPCLFFGISVGIVLLCHSTGKYEHTCTMKNVKARSYISRSRFLYHWSRQFPTADKINIYSFITFKHSSRAEQSCTVEMYNKRKILQENKKIKYFIISKYIMPPISAP